MPAKPVEKPAVIAAVEKPEVETVEKAVPASVEKPAAAVDEADDISAERPVAVSDEGKSVVEVARRPEAPTIVTSAEPAAVAEKVLAKPVEKPVVIATVEKPLADPAVAAAEKPIVAAVEKPKVATNAEKPDEKAIAASAHVVVAPTAIEAPVPQAVQVAPEVAAMSAASARTEAIVETVNQVVEAIVGQILVTPGIVHGECEVKIMLKPTVLDGSEITMSSKDGTLTVSIAPATQKASAAAAAALPRLETALAEHAPSFNHVSVALALKKGKRNEAV